MSSSLAGPAMVVGTLLLVVLAVWVAARYRSNRKAKFERQKKIAFESVREQIELLRQGDDQMYELLGESHSELWRELSSKYANTTGWASLVDARGSAIRAYELSTEKAVRDETLTAYTTWMRCPDELSAYEELQLFTRFLELRRGLQYSIDDVNRVTGGDLQLTEVLNDLLMRTMAELRTGAEAGSREDFEKAQNLLDQCAIYFYRGLHPAHIKPGGWSRIEAQHLLRINPDHTDYKPLRDAGALLAAREALASRNEGGQLNIWLVKMVLAWCHSNTSIRAQVGDDNINALADLVLYHARLTGIPIPA